MSNPANRGKGFGIKFIRDLIANAPPTCVTWPLFRDKNGYGRVGYLGKQPWAHILVCEMVNGPRPSEGHEAAHSCGNGKHGCVNPRHLSWQTRSRNQLDRRHHGTKAQGYRGYTRKLTSDDVEQIRVLVEYLTQREIAGMFGVSDATIRDILRGKSWSPMARKDRLFTVAEVEEIKKLAGYLFHPDIAAMFGVHRAVIDRIVKGQTHTTAPLLRAVA